ncbi:putative kynurenine 3-monooxygenase [Diplogelasinospora grovesii]|uniref:Kynurenine 3-monooxygenase n=1 Tax=Diplogelasinospora grovesii TaxID=303347 RepID=A0AAN6NB10_9PEZI|nr:putative kynurenine 3-monooxygenase [Diplogelasinospora grovesii]
MFTKNDSVAIIGGGISGMALALCLHSMHRRPSLSGSRTEGGSMMIAANALRMLDSWGVYPKMVPRGHEFQYVHYKDDSETTADRYPFGGRQNFGYDGLRIYRQELINVLYETCAERGIPFNFNTKYTRITQETATSVTSELTTAAADQTIQKTAALLVGADGIHSKVRDYPKFAAHLMAITYEVPLAQLRIPADKNYVFPVQVTTGKGGTPDGSLLLCGTQYPVPEEDKSRSEWAEIVQGDMHGYPDVIRSALEQVSEETLHVWPFYVLPKLANWASEKKRVVVLGDAAHAVPPTTGQGASQAFEDVFSLGLLLAKMKGDAGVDGQGGTEGGKVEWAKALQFWQDMRQRRIEELLVLTKQLNNKRLPLHQQTELAAGEVWVDQSAENPRQMAWLYEPNIKEQIDNWVAQQV